MNGTQRYHVGLVAGTLAHWGGGRDLLRMLALGLSEANVQMTLVIPGPTPKQRASKIWRGLPGNLRSLSGGGKRPQPAGGESIIDYLRQTGCAFDVVHTPGSRRAMARTLRRHGIDVILPADPLPRGSRLRWVGYVADLQHKYLPHFFTQKMMKKRDRAYAAVIQKSRTVMVNSRDAKRDMERFYPCKTCEIFELPCSPLLEPGWLDADPAAAREKYGLKRPYFVISNQFWIHKDHPTAIRALSMLAEKKVDLVCTGKTSDLRAPEHFPAIQRLVSELGLSERVKFVGHVPKLDQIAIMRGAAAVVQPTLFEGDPGGGSIYNAVALGVPAILSDIPVNLELEDETARFFAHGSAEDLARQMTSALSTGYEPLDRQVLVERSAARQRRLGAALRRIIEYAMAVA